MTSTLPQSPLAPKATAPSDLSSGAQWRLVLGVAFLAAMLAFVPSLGGIGTILGYFTLLPFFILAFMAPSRTVGYAGMITSLILSVLGDAYFGFAFAVVVAAPIWFLARFLQLYRTNEQGQIFWYPMPWLIVALSLYALGMFAAAVISTSFQGEHMGLALISQSQNLDAGLQQLITELTATMPPEHKAENIALFQRLMAFIIQHLPTIFVGSWYALMAFNATLAFYIVRKFAQPLRQDFNLNAALVPYWFTLLFALLLFVAVQPWSAEWAILGRNAAIIISLPLLVQGLSVVHFYARKRNHSTYLLLGFYALFSLSLIVPTLTILLGILEQKFNWRTATPELSSQINN